MSNSISEYYSNDKQKKATVLLDPSTSVYWVDFFKDNKCFISLPYPGKSIHFVEDVAENFVTGILKDPEAHIPIDKTVFKEGWRAVEEHCGQKRPEFWVE
jgi:hypothetical protein